MASQQKQIFFIILLAAILVIGGAMTLYYWFNNDATAKHEQVLKNIEKSNQDFLHILEQNRAALEALSATSTATTTPITNSQKEPINPATSSDPLAPTL